MRSRHMVLGKVHFDGGRLMNKPALGLVAVLALLGVSFAAQKERSFSGIITDRYCAKANSHEMMMKRHNSPTTKECIPACVKAGGAYVLFDAATKTMYELGDQKKPALLPNRTSR